jgi:DNA-binding FrmR family transcriptional regulator
MKKSEIHLINNVIGQLEGVKRMLEGEEDCYKVIIQMKAAKGALENAFFQFTEKNLLHCAAQLGKKDRAELEKLLKEIIKK